MSTLHTRGMHQNEGCIYKITNKVNGKYYFGKSVQFKKRMNQHRRSAKKPKTYLARAIKKHGWDRFKVEILISGVPSEDLDMLEKSYIEIYDSMNRNRGYNLTKGGDGTSGYVQSEEQRRRTSRRMKEMNSKRDQFGSVSYLKSQKVWRVVGPRNAKQAGEYVGQYKTKTEGKHALEVFNKTGKKLRATIKRERGTGSITKQYKSYGAFYKGKYIGSYRLKKDAEKSIEHFIKTGIARPSDNTYGKGCIQEVRGRFRASYLGKRIGLFPTKEEAQQALEHFKQTGDILPSSIKKRRGSVRKRGPSRFEALYKGKRIGTFCLEEEAEEAIKIHLQNLDQRNEPAHLGFS